jgi:UDP-glucose 4-epimerase
MSAEGEITVLTGAAPQSKPTGAATPTLLDVILGAPMTLLLTGGAGYIGSHVLLQLAGQGHDIVVADNLSTGHEWAVLAGRLARVDLGDEAAMDRLFQAQRFDAVLHFAASIVVPESVTEPLKYYANNTGNMLRLLQHCARHGVQRFIFSSTAAVYGLPPEPVVSEDQPLAPINPYGASKMMSERMLMDLGAASSMRYVILRYFNVAGADPQGRIGQASANATHLIKVACETALGQRPSMQIFGTDYGTPDGTCIRDYIHVDDLARAHLDALSYLERGGPSTVLNCGYGHGYSVRQVIESVRRVSGRPLAAAEGPRRAGDAVQLVADSARIRRVLGWQPRHDDLDFIVQTAWRWEQKYAARA